MHFSTNPHALFGLNGVDKCSEAREFIQLLNEKNKTTEDNSWKNEDKYKDRE